MALGRVTAVALVVPSFYALYVWYKQHSNENECTRDETTDEPPLALVSSNNISLKGHSHVSFTTQIKSTTMSPAPTQTSVLVTSRGDIAVHYNDDMLSDEALDYFAEVTAIDEALPLKHPLRSIKIEDELEDDKVIISRRDFDLMMSYVAQHFKELPYAVGTTTSMSIQPTVSSIESVMSQVLYSQPKTPLSQIFLLVDEPPVSRKSIQPSSTTATTTQSPPASVVREIVHSLKKHDEPPAPPPVSLLRVPRAKPRPKPVTPPPTARIWETFFGSSAFQNNPDLDQSYFVFH